MTEPYYADGTLTVLHGDSLAVLRDLEAGSVDAVVTDPPYGIRFMGKAWDGEDIERGAKLRQSQAAMPLDGKAGQNGGYRSTAAEAGRYDLSPSAMESFERWCQAWAAECLRILKPGGHLLAFGGSRTFHRLAAGIEDAGFEIRDSIMWIYGSGFPKSLDVSKAIDRAAGAERTVVGRSPFASRKPNGTWHGDVYGSEPAHGEGPSITAPATDAARRWQGWGTAAKPAHEPVVVARKPLAGTVAANVLAYGTGALNVDACRVGAEPRVNNAGGSSSLQRVSRVEQGYPASVTTSVGVESTVAGRWPANVALDDEAAAELDRQSGTLTSGSWDGKRNRTKFTDQYGHFDGGDEAPRTGDVGGASRFFPVFRYEAKADQAERPVVVNGVRHPTVKPLALMRWLVRLVTPPGGTVLDPFAGSGTTLEAALLERFRCIGIEREADYLPLIRQRIDRHRDAGSYLESRGELEGTLFDHLDDESEAAS